MFWESYFCFQELSPFLKMLSFLFPLPCFALNSLLYGCINFYVISLSHRKSGNWEELSTEFAKLIRCQSYIFILCLTDEAPICARKLVKGKLQRLKWTRLLSEIENWEFSKILAERSEWTCFIDLLWVYGPIWNFC